MILQEDIFTVWNCEQQNITLNIKPGRDCCGFWGHNVKRELGKSNIHGTDSVQERQKQTTHNIFSELEKMDGGRKGLGEITEFIKKTTRDMKLCGEHKQIEGSVFLL